MQFYANFTNGMESTAPTMAETNQIPKKAPAPYKARLYVSTDSSCKHK